MKLIKICLKGYLLSASIILVLFTISLFQIFGTISSYGYTPIELITDKVPSSVVNLIIDDTVSQGAEKIRKFIIN